MTKTGRIDRVGGAGVIATCLTLGLSSQPGLVLAQDAVPRGDSGVIKKDAQAAETQDKSAPARLVTFVKPVHPKAAKNLEAKVIVLLDINESGRVQKATLEKGAGNGFDESALAAADGLVFEPAKDEDGQPIATQVRFRFSFTLEKAEEPEPEPAEVQPSALSGTVIAEGDAEVGIVGAKLTLTQKNGATTRTITTDGDGRFDFPDLAPGEYTVTIEAPGFSSSTIDESVSLQEPSEVKYRLFIASDAIEVTVRGSRPPREVVKRTISKREIDRVPGTNGDALRSLQNLPGVARPPAIAGLLLVRGSGPQDTQTFIDGTPVPLIYHFGGLSSVVPTEVLDRIDFYPGNFGAEYGRVMGGIVDVGLRTPKDDGYHGLVQSDLIDARALVEGPIASGWTFLVSGRRSYIDAWLGPVLEAAGSDVTQAPVYYDYQAILEHNSPEVGRFRAAFLGSDDALELLVRDPVPGEPALSGNLGLHTAFQRMQFLYERDLGKRDTIKTVAAFGHDDIDFNFGSIYFLLDVLSFNTRAEHSHRFSPGLRLNSGVDIFSGRAEVRLRLPEQNSRPGEPPNQPFSTRPFIELQTAATAIQSAFYTELEIEPLPSIRIVPGIRLDHFSYLNDITWSPRVSARVGLHNEFPRTTLKTGVGVFHQPPQFQQFVPPLGTPDLNSNQAIHYALGLEQELTPNIDVSGEGFVKQLDSLVIGTPSIGGAGLSYDNRGSGYVAGGEFLLRYKPDDRFFGWLAYTISRSVRQDGPTDPEYLVNFDQTHILTVLGSYQLGDGWEIGARFRLVSGNLTDPNVCDPSSEGCDPTRTNSLFHAPSGAYVPIPLGNNTERLPPFHALDLRVDKKWKFKYWALSAYLDVQNVYNHQNVEGLGYNFNFTARSEVAGLPILPSLGLRGDFGQ